MIGKRGRTHTYRSKELKLSIVKKVLGGKSSKEVGKEAGISDSLIRTWVRQYQKDGEAAEDFRCLCPRHIGKDKHGVPLK